MITRKERSPLGWPLIQVMVNRRHKILYSPIAKNANTSLKRAMVRYSDLENIDEILEYGVHRYLDNNYTGLQLWDLKPEEVDEVISDPSYFSFSVLREPYERLVSAYVEKFVLHRQNEIQWQHIGEVMAAVQGCAITDVCYETGISFREFVQYLMSLAPVQLDPHWAPQFMYLSGFPYAKLYKMTDLKVLEEDLSRHMGREFKLEHINKSNRTKSRQFVPEAINMNAKELSTFDGVAVDSFMNEELYGMVRRYYALDYSLYNML